MKNRIRDEAGLDLGSTLERAKESLAGALESERAAQAVHAVEDYVTRHPALSLGIAASVGVIVGCLIKRR